MRKTVATGWVVLMFLVFMAAGGCTAGERIKEHTLPDDLPEEPWDAVEVITPHFDLNNGGVESTEEHTLPDDPPGEPWDAAGVITRHCDLNNDGVEDAITLTLADEQYNAYTLQVNEAVLDVFGDNIEPVFNIVDIDVGDTYKEIAVSEYGPSSDHATAFFYYTGKEIIPMGKIGGFYGTACSYGPDVNWGQVVIDGSGVISTLTRGAILHTWFYRDEFKLSPDHLLVNIPKDLYEMNYEVEVIREIALQRSRTDATVALTLKEGEKVTIVASDNREWCCVRNAQGETGWFAVDNYRTIRGLGIPAYEVFSGLCYAD